MVSALAGSAWAQEEGDPCGGDAGMEGEGEGMGEAEAMPEESAPAEAADGADMGGKPPMILAKGKLAVNVPIGISLSTDAVAKPIAIAPDVWYGVAPKLEAGLAHSNMSITGFWFQGFGSGLCLTGEDNGCAELYNGPIGLLAHYTLMEGNLDLAADGGVLINTLDPMALGLKVGVMGRYISGKIAVHFQPNLTIGLTERDFNKEALYVPVTLGYMVSEKLHAGLQTGIYGPLDGFGDFFGIPLGVGAMFMVNESIGVAGSFNFIQLAGGSDAAGADFRDLTLAVMWHN
ncbi:MAG: hypothetical protein F9K40_17630 [Kofleriaceae bacterium]|nr:MAG: hypothetical protein F9K40_17630 [Kofleriaceae bacterium]MBZ0236997.1 hypothetical protein [Kofleriaceae bacterium]